MARNFTVLLPATCFIPDANSFNGADAACDLVAHLGRPALALDDTTEEGATSVEFLFPAEYTGSGTLKLDVFFAMASDATNDISLNIYVEAKTHGDTLDMEASASWSTANAGTASVSGTTAGDPRKLTITLTNKDSVAAGDLVRLGIVRDVGSGNDDATGDLFIYSVALYEET